jgi:CheY-like chemotaxis protein
MGNTSNQWTPILVVDRDQQTGLTIRDTLLRHGFECYFASSAASGLTSAHQQVPALMIVDTELDVCTGFDFAQTIKDEYLQHDIPVIFVSRAANDELLEASRKAGGVYLLSKPIDPSVMVELVNTALWMPHLVRRHIDAVAHGAIPRPPRMLSEKGWIRVKTFT